MARRARGPRLSTRRPARRWKSRCWRSRADIRVATTSVGAAGGGERASPEGTAVLASGTERASARQVTRTGPPRSSDRHTPVGRRTGPALRRGAGSGSRRVSPEGRAVRSCDGEARTSVRAEPADSTLRVERRARTADGGRTPRCSRPPADDVSPAGARPYSGVAGCEPRGAGVGSWLPAAAAGRCPGRVVSGPHARVTQLGGGWRRRRGQRGHRSGLRLTAAVTSEAVTPAAQASGRIKRRDESQAVRRVTARAADESPFRAERSSQRYAR